MVSARAKAHKNPLRTHPKNFSRNYMSMQVDDDLKEIFEKKGIKLPGSFDSVDSFLPLIELVRQDGSVVIFKVDGERNPAAQEPPYTVMISGKIIQGGIVRSDSYDLIDAVKKVLLSYSAKVWLKN